MSNVENKPCGPGDTEAAIRAGIDLALAQIGAKDIEGRQFLVLRNPAGGFEVKDMETFQSRPSRVRGKMELHDAASFIAAVNNYKSPGETLLTAVVNEAGAEFKAVFNYHSVDSDEAGWGDHVAVFKLLPTPEWKAWSGFNKKQLGQTEFAEFLEDNIRNVVEPSGVKMLEIVRQFEAKTSCEFHRGVRLENGNVQLHYSELTDARAGEKGAFEVPTRFAIGVRMFEGTDAYKLEARFKYRLGNGKLTMWYEIEQLPEAVRQAATDVRTAIVAGTGEKVLSGAVS